MQSKIQAYDSLIWDYNRERIYEKIGRMCQRLDIDFLPSINKISNYVGGNDLVAASVIYDTIPDSSWFDDLDLDLHQKSKKFFVFTDNIIGDTYKNFSNIKIFSVPKILGITGNYSGIDLFSFQKQKLFNCFIQRVDSIRQSWFYFLYDSGLLDKGYVSFLLWQTADFSHARGQDLFREIHDKYQLGSFAHFQRAYDNLLPMVPYRNFEEQYDLIPLILNSKYSLILETYAQATQECWCFTEKTLRSLCLPTINLIFMQPLGYQILKNLGFELFDHSAFDQMAWQEKQQKFLQILVDDSQDFDRQILIDQASHNRHLLWSWREEIFSDGFFDQYCEEMIAA